MIDIQMIDPELRALPTSVYDGFGMVPLQPGVNSIEDETARRLIAIGRAEIVTAHDAEQTETEQTETEQTEAAAETFAPVEPIEPETTETADKAKTRK